MTKMNRREYLKQLGAAGLIVSVTGELAAEPQRRGRRNRPTRRITAPGKDQSKATSLPTGELQFTDWPATNVKPSMDAPVTLIFEGLMGFFYDGACEVRYHPGQKHRPEVLIWEKSSGQCSLINEIAPLPAKCKRMIVEINRPNSMVNFYERYPDRPFTDRKNGDEMDFRWLLDLNSDDFYAHRDFKVQNKFNRLLRVRHGTFYTRMISRSTFFRVDIDNETQGRIAMGHMPLAMAAALTPAANEYVSLKLQQVISHQYVTYYERKLEPTADKIYQIQFLNHCLANYGCIEPLPNHSDERRRNDWHFVRDVLDLEDVPHYGIKIDQLVEGTVHPNYCWRDIDHRISDPSPCMGAGYSGGGNG